jgi:hypothetical protein
MKMTWVATGALAAAAAFAFPAPSQAQARIGDVFGGRDSRVSRDGRYGFGDTYRIGYDKGIEDGQKRGTKDRSKGDQYSLSHDSKYRKGDAGYKKSYGPRQDYIAGYRDGYEQAYRRGYRTGDVNGRAGTYRRGRNGGRTDRNDPYGYGRDGRYGRDNRNGTDPYERDGQYGTDPYERDGRYGTDPYDPYGRDQGDGRDDRYGRDPQGRDDRWGTDPDGRDDRRDPYGDDNQEDDVIYEEPPGRW